MTLGFILLLNYHFSYFKINLKVLKKCLTSKLNVQFSAKKWFNLLSKSAKIVQSLWKEAASFLPLFL